MENANEQTIKDDAVEPTMEEIMANAKEAQLKAIQEKQEAVVIIAREKILPILKENNPCIEDAKLICDTLAIAIMQGQYQLLKDHKVEDLKLLDIIKEGYPGYKTVCEIVKAINNESMELGIEGLQWFVEKIKKMIEDENKDRKFEELKMEL
jgi:hypothetical protein